MYLETLPPALAGQVERGIRPCAWMTRGTLDGKAKLTLPDCTANEAYTKAHNSWCWEPLYDAASLKLMLEQAKTDAEFARLRGL